MSISAPTHAALARVPPFPAVAVKLLTLLSDESSSFSSVAACIVTDPVLSGRLINRANAADVMNYCEVATVLQAVGTLGMERTRELSLTLATASYTSAARKAEALQHCWHHTLATALIAADLARFCGLRPAEAYTAGLMHDIGRLGLITAFPAQYEKLLADASAPILDLERAAFGIDHREAGPILAREWNLPESLTAAIVHHADPPRGALTDTSLVHLACRLAGLLGFPADPELGTLEEIAAPLPDFVRSRLASHLPAVKSAILREIGLSDAVEQRPARDAEDATPSDASPEPAQTLAVPRNPAWKFVAAGIVLLLATALIVWLRS